MSTVEDDDQDPTRKQRREQARERRKELDRSELAGSLRRARLTQLGLAVVIGFAIIIGILVATGGGKSSTPKPGSPQANRVVSEVTALLGGIPQSGNSLGSSNAPVTLQYFSDLQCPVCRDFTLGALKPLIENDVRAGKLKIEYRSLETSTGDRETFKRQQVSALAAGKQQKAWYYIELFYHEQGEEHSGYASERYLQGLAQQVPGLNLINWTSDRANSELANAITTDAKAARNFGFTGTPAFALGKTGVPAKKFEPESFTDAGSFVGAIARAAKG